jgi:hypothetical protein
MLELYHNINSACAQKVRFKQPDLDPWPKLKTLVTVASTRISGCQCSVDYARLRLSST